MISGSINNGEHWLVVVAVSQCFDSFLFLCRVVLLIVDPGTVCLSGHELKKDQVHQSCQGVGEIGVHPPDRYGHSRVV